MQSLNRIFSDTLSAVSACCPPLASCLVGDDKHQRRDTEKPLVPEGVPSAQQFLQFGNMRPTPLPYYGYADRYEHQESRYGQPWGVPPRPVARPSTKETQPRKSLSSSIRSFSVKKHKKADSRGRPFISAPTNFRHVYHETVDMPTSLQQPRKAPQPRRFRPFSFRPLELSIYQSQQQLSPLLPEFDLQDDSILQPPAPVYTRSPTSSDDASTLVHQRSGSSMSFHLPRRGTAENLSSFSGRDVRTPTPPPKSKARMRAHTSPNTERMLERIASAIIEKERIQEQIDHVIERQSIYSNSRPSTGHAMRELEPMPSIPAVPPTEGLTFAERVSTPAPLAPERPRTAPPKPATPVSAQNKTPVTPTEISLPQVSPLRTVAARTPPPPLPLVLRPPLRKKKSFSRVSNWLFPGQEHEQNQHGRSFSQDSVTNAPRPVKNTEGFYQCVAPSGTQRTSFDSVSSVSAWSTQDEEPTAASSWSPDPSSPGSSRAAAKMAAGSSSLRPAAVPQRAGTFGSAHAHRRESVGVAF